MPLATVVKEKGNDSLYDKVPLSFVVGWRRRLRLIEETMEWLSVEERAAASAVASLNASKRNRIEEDSPDAAGGMMIKRARVAPVDEENAPANAGVADESLEEPERPLKPYPFYYYLDFSTMEDPDPLTPLTLPGRVPNFPAKMHSILSRKELSDIVAWLPHGRSWRILKPREFEVKVIPTYFEHAKFSSFIRQANGWGFRRITQGLDRNSYYHELFLRGLPHLCKEMKRPRVAEKVASDPDHEPDFEKISELHPVPEKSKDDSILLQCTVQGGPKARMPIYTGSIGSSIAVEAVDAGGVPAYSVAGCMEKKLTPTDTSALSAFQQALGASEDQFKNLNISSVTSTNNAAAQPVVLPPNIFANVSPAPVNMPMGTQGAPAQVNALAAANQLAFANPNLAGAAAASQFAAGFAAAAALSQQQFRIMMESFAQSIASVQHSQAQLAPKSPPGSS